MITKIDMLSTGEVQTQDAPREEVKLGELTDEELDILLSRDASRDAKKSELNVLYSKMFEHPLTKLCDGEVQGKYVQ